VRSHLGRIEGVSVYKNDVVVRRRGGHRQADPPTRGEVKEFSYQSRQRLAFVAANTDVVFSTMITLTYPRDFPSDGIKVKRDLRAFLDFCRRDLEHPFYLWWLEFQLRGAPHIHLLLDWPFPRTRQDRSAICFRVSATWYRIVGSGDPKHLAAGTRTERLRSAEGGARYCVKEACKMYQKLVPELYRNVGRFWGCSRAVIPTCKAIHRCTEDDVRAALEGWKYAPKDDQDVYKLIFGAAHLFPKEDTTNGG